MIQLGFPYRDLIQVNFSFFVILISILIINAIGIPGNAQSKSSEKNDSLNLEMKKIAKAGSNAGLIKFKDDVNINPLIIFKDHKSAFNLRDDDKLIHYQTDKDGLGYTHFRFQQYYKNIKVEGGIYVIHTNENGKTYAANGKLFTGIDINTAPSINSTQAIEFALAYVSAKKYKWQSDYWEKNLKERTGNPDTSYYPSPRLSIKEFKINNDKSHSKGHHYILVYQIDIYSNSPDYSQRLFIDANSGLILKSLPLQSN